MSEPGTADYVDVLIVGAGLSGIARVRMNRHEVTNTSESSENPALRISNVSITLPKRRRR